MTFDIFRLLDDHDSHPKKVHWIKLDNGKKLICRQCVENQMVISTSIQGQANGQSTLRSAGAATSRRATPNDENVPPRENQKVSEIDETLYQQYMRNMFEVLEKRSQFKDARWTILPILDVLTKRRPIVVKDEYDYHNLIRVVNKLPGSLGFELDEFVILVRIFKRFAFSHHDRSNKTNQSLRGQSNIPRTRFVPLVPLWAVIKRLLEYAERYRKTALDSMLNSSSTEYFDFFVSLMKILASYLKLMNQYSLGTVSDIITPISKTDDPSLHDRDFHIANQNKCLDIASDRLIEKIVSVVRTVPQESTEEIMDLSRVFFNCLCPMFTAALRCEHKFVDLIAELDVVQAATFTLIHNDRSDLRKNPKLFLSIYVHQMIKKMYGNGTVDSRFEEIKTCNFVATSRIRIIANPGQRSKKLAFYLMLNNLAMKTQSAYYKVEKVRVALKQIRKVDLEWIQGSRILMKCLVSIIANSHVYFREALDSQDTLSDFLLSQWTRSVEARNCIEFHELFCSEDSVFYAFYENEDFAKAVKGAEISYIFNRSVKEKNLIQVMKNLSSHNLYKKVFIKFLRYELSSLDIIQQLSLLDEEIIEQNRDAYSELLCRLGSTLPVILNKELNNLFDDPQKPRGRLHRVLNMNITLMKNCQSYCAIIDDQLINDLAETMEDIFGKYLTEKKDTLILMNEFVTMAIDTNNPSLLKLLHQVNFAIMGYTIYWLINGDAKDELTKSIGRLFVAYWSLDYPIEFKILDELKKSSISNLKICDWMLSDNEDIQLVSLLLFDQSFYYETNKGNRIFMIQALLQLLYKQPKFINQPRLYESIYSSEEYNRPQIRERFEKLFKDCELPQHEFDQKPHSSRCSSLMSFTEATETDREDSQQNDSQGEFNLDRILTELDGSINDNSCVADSNLFITPMIMDNNLSRRSNSDSWTDMANGIINWESRKKTRSAENQPQRRAG